MPEFQQPSGLTFASKVDVRAADLSSVLCKTVAFIQAWSPYIRLERYDDWWEHDGLHFFRKAISIEELFAIVHSPRSLLDSMPGDFDVFLGIYSVELGAYLRFYVEWNDDETEVMGRFDVTFPIDLAERFRREVVSICGLEIVEMDSHKYYQSIIL